MSSENFKTNLESVNISQSVLNVAVHHQLAETQHLSAQMEGIAKSGLLSLLEDKRQTTTETWLKYRTWTVFTPKFLEFNNKKETLDCYQAPVFSWFQNQELLWNKFNESALEALPWWSASSRASGWSCSPDAGSWGSYGGWADWACCSPACTPAGRPPPSPAWWTERTLWLWRSGTDTWKVTGDEIFYQKIYDVKKREDGFKLERQESENRNYISSNGHLFFWALGGLCLSALST